MLLSLSIKNIALIDEAEIEFCDGLNILSGETGAGKSVILDSLNFVLGAKADKTMIRHGASFCIVSCTFLNYPETINEILAEYDVESSTELIIKRKFDVNGNGYIKLNGENVTATMLRKITSRLVDVHGQSEHFSLLSKVKQLECIDHGAQTKEELMVLSELIAKLNQDEKQLDSLCGTVEERLKRLDLLEYQINEIEKADLKEGEQEQLLLQKNKLLNLDKLSTSLQTAYSAISDEEGITDRLITVEQSLKSISDIDDSYAKLLDRIRSIREDVSDIASLLNDKFDELDPGGINLDEIEQRLEIYHNFSRKYGASVGEIELYLQNAINERNVLINFEKNSALLIEKIEKQKEKIYSLCKDISNKRRDFSKSFEKRVTEKLFELGMPKAQFSVEFEDLLPLKEIKQFTSSGLDKIEFMFSANAGEPIKPLSKIISGGEMSRFMLALKTQLSVDSLTYVFDEIDAGISGITAGIIAKQFAQISKNKQVIAISHLPQIAAMSDRSLLIVKHEEDDKTHTNVSILSSDSKIQEIIRLIGGRIDDPIAVSHAKNMVADAENYKKSI